MILYYNMRQRIFSFSNIVSLLIRFHPDAFQRIWLSIGSQCGSSSFVLHVVQASTQYLKYRCALLYFYHIYVGVIDRTNISNIWRYLCPIIACVVSNIGLSTFHLKLFATLCNKSSAHSIHQQIYIIDMDSFLITQMFGG